MTIDKPCPEANDLIEAAGKPTELESLLEHFGLVLTDDPDFDHDEQTFGKAKDALVTALRHSPDLPADAEGVDELIGALLVHQCGCGGECGMRTPPYIKQAAQALMRLRIDAALRAANTGRAEVLELLRDARLYVFNETLNTPVELSRKSHDLLAKIDAALSSPPVTAVPDPEIATAVEAAREAMLRRAAQRATARLERTDWKPTRAHYESLRNEINAAIRSRPIADDRGEPTPSSDSGGDGR